MLNKLRPWGCIPVLALTAVATAQSQLELLVPGGQWIETEERPWIAGLPSVGQVRHCVSARLTTRWSHDVVTLIGTSPVLGAAPGIHSATVPLPGVHTGPDAVTNDLATLPAAGLDGRDALALVGPAGLRIWRATPNGQPGEHQLTVADATAWIGALQVATYPGEPDSIFGVAADGTTLLLATAVNGMYTTTTIPRNGIGSAPALPILAIQPLRWDPDQLADLAVLTGDGLGIYSRSGGGASLAEWAEVVAPSAYASPARSITRIRYLAAAGVAGGAPECIAWILPNVLGGTRLLVRGVSEDEELEFDENFVALSAADWSLDTQDDLFMTRDYGQGVTLLINAYAAEHRVFMDWFGFRIDLDPNSADNLAPVALADFDNDGDGDLVAPVIGTAQQPSKWGFVRTKPYHPTIVPQVQMGSFETSTVTGRIAVQLPLPQFETNDAPFTPTHAEVIVWPAELGQATSHQLVPELEDRRVVSLAGINMTLSLDEIRHTQVGVFFYAIRPVLLDLQENVIATGRPRVGALFTDQFVFNQFAGRGGIRVPAITPKPALPPTPPEPPLPPRPPAG